MDNVSIALSSDEARALRDVLGRQPVASMSLLEGEVAHNVVVRINRHLAAEHRRSARHRERIADRA